MENLDIWNKLCTPPQAALKKIVAGRMKGKADINPQWRMKAMTAAFGPVGFGWAYSIDKMWLEPGSDNQVSAFVMVSVRIKHDGEWSEPIPGTGGSMFIAKEKSGLFTSDEAYKMATTDALSVALKAIGVAGDIYMGIFDGANYPSEEPITEPQLTELEAEINERVVDVEKLLAFAKVDNLSAIDKTQFNSILAAVKSKPVKEAS